MCTILLRKIVNAVSPQCFIRVARLYLPPAHHRLSPPGYARALWCAQFRYAGVQILRCGGCKELSVVHVRAAEIISTLKNINIQIIEAWGKKKKNVPKCTQRWLGFHSLESEPQPKLPWRSTSPAVAVPPWGKLFCSV